jgi:hypothetical protein
MQRTTIPLDGLARIREERCNAAKTKHSDHVQDPLHPTLLKQHGVDSATDEEDQRDQRR